MRIRLNASSFTLLLPLLLFLLLALLLEEVEAQDDEVVLDFTNVLSNLFLPFKKELTPKDASNIRGGMFILGAGFLQVATIIYGSRKTYRKMVEKYGTEDDEDEYDEDEYAEDEYAEDEYAEDEYAEDEYAEDEDEDEDESFIEAFIGGALDYAEDFRRIFPKNPPPPPPLPPLPRPLLHPPPPPPPQRRRYVPPQHKRSLRALPPAAEDLQETLREILKEEDLQEMVMRTAGFVQEVMEELDEDGCLLKLLCHLQEKPKDTRAPEEELLMSLYLLKVPKSSPTCRQESFKCPMKETQLLKAFSYTWQQNNAA